MSVDRLLELLKQFKDSTNKRERVWPARFCTTVDFVLPCHCKQPDVEVAFSLIPRPTPAQKRFPERELQITGKLFGGIIEHGLVTPPPKFRT